MRLSPVSLVLLLCLLAGPVSAQTRWQAATIYLDGRPMSDLLGLGIAFDHGHYHPGEHFSGDFTLEELARIEAAGFVVERRDYHALSSRGGKNNCSLSDQAAPYFPLPANFPFGGMNGYPTLSEVYESLELMEAFYPNLITVRQVIGDFRTFEGRRIYYVKISDNPTLDESEPEVLFTALHHAREPAGMAQMLFFMWHLLENYQRDPQVRALVDNRELFFIPCVNPDGYAYNEETNPSGGGFWRKNRNPNPDDVGTDLNRNYGYGWAYNNDGSSPAGTSDVFRGTGAFSEVETQAVKYFCEQRDLSIALNYHSFGNLLILPWGYLNQATEDSLLYYRMAYDMTRYNQFTVGTSNQTLNYSVNGVSDDWMYGERISKGKIFAFTPEVGYAFWPERKDITPINQSTQYMNFAASWNAGSCAHVSENGSPAISGDTSRLDLVVTRTGIVGKPVNVHLESTHPGVQFLDNDLEWVLGPGESAGRSARFVIDPPPARGDTVRFTITLKTDVFEETITRSKIYAGVPNWRDAYKDLYKWQIAGLSGWSLTDERFVSPPYSLTDSPQRPMDPNEAKIVHTTDPIDLTNAQYAILRFRARWQMDKEADFAQVKLSTNGSDYHALCGMYTINGNFSQAFDEPVYCGIQDDWVTEWIDLSDYLGHEIYLQLYLYSGQNLNDYDGMYIDDLEVFTNRNVVADERLESSRQGLVFPQPNHGVFALKLLPVWRVEAMRFTLTNASGESQEIVPTVEHGLALFNTNARAPGVYVLSATFPTGSPQHIKIVIH
ncbi:MAG: immune inhibitor A [Saprospiraceae bacterium]|nr:immune inhibitor A [Saprospiraceae bacterium]